MDERIHDDGYRPPTRTHLATVSALDLSTDEIETYLAEYRAKGHGAVTMHQHGRDGAWKVYQIWGTA